MAKKYILKLTTDERVDLERLVRRGHVAGWRIQRAQASLHRDQGPNGPGWTDERIAEAYGTTTRSLKSWRKRAVEEGPMALMERKVRATPAASLELDGEKHARLTALACSKPPDGLARWSLRLLAELEVVEAVSHETVRRSLKKAT